MIEVALIVGMLACLCGGTAAIALVILVAKALRLYEPALRFADRALHDPQLDELREQHYRDTAAVAAALDELGAAADNVFPLHPDQGGAEVIDFPGGAAA